ncbi:hypothetical protein [Nocardiopsis sp. JB363]|uniref:hypothetical protein n=1 Tax=Nocardiopsis sp. JB363 TaxID=1434837 RepID=UPI00097A6293|nr:hypothetical protein [Nocardiopsis sp. JB363]SIO89803.1 hypothetical protein BQ8420_23455 [Nocardiopsis sp. JB363]
MSRYLNLSDPAYVRHRVADPNHRRRLRKAGRVRIYASSPRTSSGGHQPGSPRPPLIPAPRRPLDTVPLDVLRDVLTGLQRLEVAI